MLNDLNKSLAIENKSFPAREPIIISSIFYFNRPTELDALVFGHIFTILTTPLPDNRLASIVRQHKNLTDLCQGIDKEYFDRMASSRGSENFEKIP